MACRSAGSDSTVTAVWSLSDSSSGHGNQGLSERWFAESAAKTSTSLPHKPHSVQRSANSERINSSGFVGAVARSTDTHRASVLASNGGTLPTRITRPRSNQKLGCKRVSCREIRRKRLSACERANVWANHRASSSSCSASSAVPNRPSSCFRLSSQAIHSGDVAASVKKRIRVLSANASSRRSVSSSSRDGNLSAISAFRRCHS